VTIDSNQVSVKFLFERHHTFEVPKYQRGYAWDDEALDDFVDDLSRCLKSRSSGSTRSHFFGGVVTVRQQIPKSSRSHFEVIDGQQRLASFVLLVAAIKIQCKRIVDTVHKKSALGAAERRATTFLETTIADLHSTYLAYKDEIDLEYVEIPKLRLSKADNSFFQDLIKGEAPKVERASHGRMLAAWKCLLTFVEEDILRGSTVKEKAKQLQLLVNGVLAIDCSVIFMCSDTRSEAYQIFQVLNDRGVHLTDGDLLRASTMELLDRKELRAIQNDLSDAWDRILTYPPSDIDSYLRWYFSSREGKRPKSSNLADQFLNCRFKCDEGTSIGKRQAEGVLAEAKNIDGDFSTLQALGDGDWPYYSHSNVTAWDRERLRMLVTHLKHTNAMPLLLSLKLLDEKKFAEAVTSIERFVFRYKTIGNAHIGPMTELYLKHAKAIRSERSYSTKTLRADLRALVEKIVPDKLFEANLYELRYSPRSGNGRIKYLFIALEDYAKWYKSGARGAPRAKDKSRILDFTNTTLEHIYPRSAPVKSRSAQLEHVKDSIGNLTILGPNDNNDLANKTFSEKRALLSESHLRLNRELAQHDTWNVARLKQREKDLAEMALKIFVP